MVAVSDVTPDSSRLWRERLSELLDFRKTGQGDGDWTWKCGGPDDASESDYDRLYLAKQAAGELGLNFDELMENEQVHGHRCCDCEIIFNSEDDEEE